MRKEVNEFYISASIARDFMEKSLNKLNEPDNVIVFNALEPEYLQKLKDGIGSIDSLKEIINKVKQRPAGRNEQLEQFNFSILSAAEKTLYLYVLKPQVT